MCALFRGESERGGTKGYFVGGKGDSMQEGGKGYFVYLEEGRERKTGEEWLFCILRVEREKRSGVIGRNIIVHSLTFILGRERERRG